MNQNCDDPQCSAKRQRSRIAHEHLRWMTIEPKETQTGSDHRRAKHGQFCCPRHMRYQQILRCFYVVSDVSQYDKNHCDDQCATNRQAIESVSQIYCVRKANDDQHRQNQANDRRPG